MVSENSEEDISQLQMLEQNLQNILAQKQKFQTQIIELESAISETTKTKESYKIIGNIMVSVDSIELNKDLTNKKEVAELRIKTLEKQENSLREKAKEIQSKVLKQMKEKGGEEEK